MTNRIHVGNAPCSWGSLEFEGMEAEPVRFAQMLDELRETGYTGTELGDWGYMPTDPSLLAATLLTRHLTLTGAFVPVALANAASHAAGAAEAVRVATLLSTTARLLGSDSRPFLVLADENGTVPERTQNAGRITPEMGLTDAQWRTFSEGADRIARAVRDETGLRTVFHHHCAGYVETPAEITRLLDETNPALVGLVFDTGHYAFGAGGCESMFDALDQHAERIWYMHFKDCSEGVRQQVVQEQLDYFEAVRRGVFCELGRGCVDFPAVIQWLRAHNYDGFVTVEQDVLPGMGAPRQSAASNRAYLRTHGL